MSEVKEPKTVIKIDNVRKVYEVEGRDDVIALNGVNLDIKKNEFR